MRSESETSVSENTLAFNNDYTIDAETLKTSVKFASMSSMVLLAMLNIGLTTAEKRSLGYFLIWQKGK